MVHTTLKRVLLETLQQLIELWHIAQDKQISIPLMNQKILGLYGSVQKWNMAE